MAKVDVIPYVNVVKWVTRDREGSKISKNGWCHLWKAQKLIYVVNIWVLLSHLYYVLLTKLFIQNIKCFLLYFCSLYNIILFRINRCQSFWIHSWCSSVINVKNSKNKYVQLWNKPFLLLITCLEIFFCPSSGHFNEFSCT